MQDQLQLIWSNLSALGPRRLAALGIAAFMIVLSIGLGAKYVNRPAYETLYVGLERDDINRIGIVLADAAISYDVDSSGTSVLVEAGKTSKARMILAEKGLPGSSGSGYELFDNLGSLGLTSFMQEVTKVRVLEGEIARSIQAISGIKAARVHIVQPDNRSFGSRNRQASASVLVRTNGSQGSNTAFAIRHLVAAAVPQLLLENVTVLDASGQLLASGEDPATSSLNNSMTIQKMVEDQLKSNVTTALSPYLGAMNFRVNVQATVDTDRRQTEETIFDPDSRVERSVQVVRTQDSTSQKASSEPASVDQNLPNAEPEAATAGPQSSAESERREETTNYELNSKKVATVSNGFEVKKLSASIILNRQRLEQVLGQDYTPEQLEERMAQIKRVAMAAMGFDEKRGDMIDVAAVEFVDEFQTGAIAEPGILDKIIEQMGTMINSIAFLIGSILLIFMGLRPMIKALTKVPESEEVAVLADETEEDPALFAADGLDQLEAPDMDASFDFEQQLDEDTENLFGQFKKSPQERLEELASENEETSAQVLRRWLDSEAA
ncbi:MAG: flagellar M-ring protein FliF [Rhizobiaceae bacterium]|nr:flagellar M-ring protein FliF [Hyphomicrobiales bacterium]NRB30528.1 flagellar M-ring protein FliF [Rhizobiaceae bacterium]